MPGVRLLPQIVAMRPLLCAAAIAVLASCASAGSRPDSASEPCLAGICLSDPSQSVRRQQRFPQLPPEVYSWVVRSPDGSRLLEVSLDEEAPEQLAVVFISSIPQRQPFPVEAHVAAVPPSSLRGHIDLGSSRAEVLAAYGPPDSSQPMAGYPWSADASGVEQVTYSHCNDGTGLPELTFFLRAGRVVGIAIWAPDC